MLAVPALPSATRWHPQLHKREESLFKKATKYSRECDVDIQVIVRMRKSGKIFTLTPKEEGWPLSESQLVGVNKVTSSCFKFDVN